jgi:hypothetical protein
MQLAYRLLTYLLLPLGLLFLFLTIASLLAATGNIAALLPAFLCGATVIYIGASFQFLHKGILDNQPLQPSLWDWIRVNGFVALFIGSLFLFQSIYFRDNPELTEQLKAQLDAMPEEVETDKLPDLTSIVSWVLNFMFICGVLIIIHIFLGFTLLRKYAHLFSRKDIR